ncbi:MAG: thiamine pyrophosphate-binding protein [Polyangiaceae bacterium]
MSTQSDALALRSNDLENDDAPASGLAPRGMYEEIEEIPASTAMPRLRAPHTQPPPALRPAELPPPPDSFRKRVGSSYVRLRDLLENEAPATLAPPTLAPPPPVTAPPPVAAPPPAVATMSASRSIVEALLAAGVDTFFGIPGGPVSPVFEAVLGTAGARLIESRHESNAAFAAMGYHRATGKVAAVIVTAGPGATNAMTGVAAASTERVPMLVICGDVPWAANGGRLLQDSGPAGIAVESMFASVTRATVRASRAESAATQALAALNAATDPQRPGPALFVLPMDIARRPAPESEPPQTRRMTEVPAAPGSVIKAAAWLAEAQRPLVIIGAGARPYAAELRRLLDVLNVPFMTTPQGKGVVSETHPHSLRHGGLAASWWARRYTQKGADVTLAIGTDLDDCSTGPTPPLATDRPARLIHVDLDPTVFHRNHHADLPIVADLRSFLTQLYDVVTLDGVRNPHGAALAREVRSGSPFDTADFASDDSPVIAPHRAIADLERAAGPDARFVTDIGEHMLFALHYLTARGPDAFTIHLGLGSMASGITSSIGLSLGDRSRPVVCVCGDGGMQMAGMELLVAAREKLPIVYAVFNDARYNMVYHGYKQLYGQDVAWDTDWVDFAMWARSFGVAGARIERPGQITPELLGTLTAQGPAVLDIRIDREKRIRGAGRNEALSHMSMRPSAV